jgi:hypothetical protein
MTEENNVWLGKTPKRRRVVSGRRGVCTAGDRKRFDTWRRGHAEPSQSRENFRD